MASFQNPVIVVPGIMGTSLHDDYPLKTVDLWTMVLNKDYHRVSMHPDNLKYEAIEPARVYAGRLFSIYNDLIEALRHDLSARADEPTPVFAFPYDWRRDVRETAKEFAAFVDEVLARTKLLRHYAGFDKVNKVDLVGHSMGGLIICEYLHQFGNKKLVGKVATMGTPYLGSMEAVVKLTTGLGNLSGERPSERERETARSTPAVYQLLPSYDMAAYKTKDGMDMSVSLFDVKNWQPSILESLAEYVRLHSVEVLRSKKDRMKRAEQILSGLLATAKAHRDNVNKLTLAKGKNGLSTGDWLGVVGIGESTRQEVCVKTINGKIRFELGEGSSGDVAEMTGDGTVPLRGAIPPFLAKEKLVAVNSDAFGMFEIGDKLLLRAAGLHAMLPAMNLVQRLVIGHLRKGFRPSFNGSKPVPGVTLAKWSPPISGVK